MRRALACAILLALWAAPAAAKPPVWVVSDGDSELVLFGSVHILPPGLDWRPAELDAALQAADDLWFETPVGAAADREGGELALKLGVLPPGQTLSGLLPRRDAERLRRLAVRYDVSMETLDGLEPWLAEALLAQVALGREDGAYVDYGVESVVASNAPAGVARKAFATTPQHMALLDGAPTAEQLASLRRTLKALERKSDFKDLLKAWMAGDVRWIQRHGVDEERRAAPALFRRLVTERNAAWTAALHERLKGRGRTVVVVGFGHLVGADGLPARLRALGYSVKGP